MSEQKYITCKYCNQIIEEETRKCPKCYKWLSFNSLDLLKIFKTKIYRTVASDKFFSPFGLEDESSDDEKSMSDTKFWLIVLFLLVSTSILLIIIFDLNIDIFLLNLYAQYIENKEKFQTISPFVYQFNIDELFTRTYQWYIEYRSKIILNFPELIAIFFLVCYCIFSIFSYFFVYVIQILSHLKDIAKYYNLLPSEDSEDILILDKALTYIKLTDMIKRGEFVAIISSNEFVDEKINILSELKEELLIASKKMNSIFQRLKSACLFYIKIFFTSMFVPISLYIMYIIIKFTLSVPLGWRYYLYNLPENGKDIVELIFEFASKNIKDLDYSNDIFIAILFISAIYLFIHSISELLFFFSRKEKIKAIDSVMKELIAMQGNLSQHIENT